MLTLARVLIGLLALGVALGGCGNPSVSEPPNSRGRAQSVAGVCATACSTWTSCDLGAASPFGGGSCVASCDDAYQTLVDSYGGRCGSAWKSYVACVGEAECAELEELSQPGSTLCKSQTETIGEVCVSGGGGGGGGNASPEVAQACGRTCDAAGVCFGTQVSECIATCTSIAGGLESTYGAACSQGLEDWFGCQATLSCNELNYELVYPGSECHYEASAAVGNCSSQACRSAADWWANCLGTNQMSVIQDILQCEGVVGSAACVAATEAALDCYSGLSCGSVNNWFYDGIVPQGCNAKALARDTACGTQLADPQPGNNQCLPFLGAQDGCDCGCGVDSDCAGQGCSTPGCSAPGCQYCFDADGTATEC